MSRAPRHFIDLRDWGATELRQLLDRAQGLPAGDAYKPLSGRTVGLLFRLPSTRTRISFETAVTQLGGSAQFYEERALQMHNEEVKDTAIVLSQFLDLLVVRYYDLERPGAGRGFLDDLRKHSSIPIVNALDDTDHPCQVMADMLTLRERYPNVARPKLVVSWAYAKRLKSPGVPNSLLVAGAQLGLNIVLAYPPGYEVHSSHVEFARKNAPLNGGSLSITHDLTEASQGAHAIYAKSWHSPTMNAAEDRDYRSTIRDSWRVSNEHFRHSDPDASFMECMPLVRGEGVDADVVDGPRSLIYQQARNRLRFQKALLAQLLSRES